MEHHIELKMNITGLTLRGRKIKILRVIQRIAKGTDGWRLPLLELLSEPKKVQCLLHPNIIMDFEPHLNIS